MLNKFFKAKSELPSYRDKLKQIGCRVDIIIIADSTGKAVFSYIPSNSEIEIDESLISMFISAISSFSQEVFNDEKSSSIVVSHGLRSIAIESNSEFCVAVLGKNLDINLKLKLNNILGYVTEFYGAQNIEDCMHFEKNVHLFVKNQFSEYIPS